MRANHTSKLDRYLISRLVNHTELATLYHFSWSISGIGICGCLLNIIVIFRIVRLGIKVVHFSRLYYLSLAVADLTVASGSVGFNFLFHDALKTEKHISELLWIGSIAWVSFTSSLLHTALITTDKFLAIAFPIYHRMNVSRKKVAVAIMVAWTISITLVASMIWETDVALWCGVIGVPMVSVEFIVAYTYILATVVKRQTTLRKQRGEKVSSAIERKTALSICLGFSITFSYIFCNLPFSIFAATYMSVGWTSQSAVHVMVLHILLTINTVIDPVLYSLADIGEKKMNRKMKTKFFNMELGSSPFHKVQTYMDLDTSNPTSRV